MNRTKYISGEKLEVYQRPRRSVSSARWREGLYDVWRLRSGPLSLFIDRGTDIPSGRAMWRLVVVITPSSSQQLGIFEGLEEAKIYGDNWLDEVAEKSFRGGY
jgi:hypothetical protein